MNELQIDLLKSNNYEVLPEVKFIKENTLSSPLFVILFNDDSKYFSLSIREASISLSDSTAYVFELLNKIELINNLNSFSELNTNQ